MIATTKVRSVLMIIGILTMAVMLQGCTLAEKVLADSYFAVIGIGADEEMTINQMQFPFLRGRGYCNDTDGSISFGGNISQAEPVPSWIYIRYTQRNRDLVPVRVFGTNVMVNSDGSIPDQSFPGVIPAGCIEPDHTLETSVMPSGGNIAEGARIATVIRYSF